MSLPEKKIKTVQLPDSNTYEIIPERLQKNSYEAALPSLTQDSVLALSSDIKYVPHFPSAMSGTAAVETSPYTSALWDATCDEVTSLYDGMMVIIRVPVAGNATYGVALKINNGTYHPVVYNISSTVGTRYGVNSTIIVVYNATQTAQMFYNSTSIVTVTGVWQVYDYDSDTDTTYRLRNSNAIYVNKSGQSTNRRTLLFEVDGGLSATNKTIAISTTKVPLNFKYIPGGQIRYYSVNGAIAANANFNASGLWEQYVIDIRYSFNTGSTLVGGNPVYIRMIVNSDGTLSQDASSAGDNPIVQELPSTADNKVYVYLGRAGGTTTLELEPIHPIYAYKDGAIRLWTNAVSSGGTATDVQINGTSITSNNVANIVTNTAYNSSSNKIATMSDISRAIIPAFNDNYASFSSDIRDYIIGSMTMRPSIIFMVRIQPYPGDFLVTCIPNENKFIITNDNERYVATVNDIYGSDYVWASLMTSANKVDYATEDEIPDLMVETTYSALKTLRDGGTLVPGTWYRITDYTTTTTQSNTSSAGHQFDVIVKADCTNKLNENAFAIQHSGDTYFANSNLNAWKLNYCLDNDTNRFAWADSTNGKGVIYRMIDEFNNDIPYDFKNILFTKSGKYTSAFTFSYTDDSTIKDASLLGLSKKCYNNIMKEFIESNKLRLNFNVFYSTSSTFNCFSNTFGNGCFNNTFGYNCRYNTFGTECANNTFGYSCTDNIFDSNCDGNTFGYGCHDNLFEYGCFAITFEDRCSYNILGGSCNNIAFGSRCEHNTFGDNCIGNNFGGKCVFNTFGNLCSYIKFGDSSSTVDYVKHIIIDDGCQYLYINSTNTSASLDNELQNAHIHLGVTGTSSAYKTITIPDRNLSYETNVYMDANGNIEMVINNGESSSTTFVDWS